MENSTELSLLPQENISTSINHTMSETELPEDMKFNSGHVVSLVGYSTLFLVSSIANCVVLVILIRRYRRQKSRVNLLLIHLAIADMIVTFLHMPLAIGWSLTVYWMAGDFFCRLLKFFDIFGMFLSSNILICISLDRFYAIVFPLSSGRAANFIKILLFGAWVVSILCAAPQVYIFHVLPHPNHTWYTQCVTFGNFPSKVWQDVYIIFGMVMIYFLPLAVILFTYSIILFTIHQKSRPENSNSQSGGDGLRRSGAGVLNRARARTLKMTVVIVLVFIFCWTPYTLSQIWFMLYGGTSLDQKIQKGLYIFACTNSVMDPIVYGYFNLRKSNRNNRNQQTAMTMGHNYNRSPTRSPSRFATSTFETTKIVTSNEHIDKISGVVQRVNDTHVGQNTLALPTNGHNIIRRTIDTANTKIESL